MINESRRFPYDIAVAVSGGKDSYYLTHLATKVLGMRPILIRVGDWFGEWEPHTDNLKNLQNAFGVSLIEWKPDPKAFRAMCRAAFEETGNLGFYDCLIYQGAIAVASYLGVPYVLFGEDSAYQYGTSDNEQDVVTLFWKSFEWMSPFLGESDTSFLRPHRRNPQATGLYASYYQPWSGYNNYQVAKSYEFKEHPLPRTGFLESYTALDALGWGISCHWKHLKFGFGRITDEVSWALRDGRLTLEDAREKLTGDGKLSIAVLKDFLRVTGYTYEEYGDILKKAKWNPRRDS